MIDRRRVEQIIELLKNSTAGELAVRSEGMYVRVRRRPQPAPTPVQQQQDQPRQQQSAAQHVETDAEPEQGDIVVKAQLVGRFYHGKGAGRPALVNIGDIVDAGQVIGSIEALGKVTGVTAPEDAEVIQVLGEDGEAVGYGAPLIRLRRRKGQ